MTTDADAARAEYDRATACDREGLEAEAIPHYEAALRLGLEDQLVPSAMLGLGSSLRNVGRFDEAVAVLGDACERFPESAASVFRVAATRIDAPEMVRYRRALDEYAAELEG